MSTNYVNPFDETDEPIDGECPRCGAGLVVKATIKDDQYLACDDECGYEEKERHVDEWSFWGNLHRAVTRLVLPVSGWVRVAAVAVVVLAVALWWFEISAYYWHVGLVGLGLYFLSTLSSRYYCGQCGHRVSEPPGFCRNCGAHTGEAIEEIPDIGPQEPSAIAKWVATRSSEAVEIDGPHVVIRWTAGAGFIDRLADGREWWWRRVLDAGVILATLVSVASLALAVLAGWAAARDPGPLTTGVQSSGGESAALPTLPPDIWLLAFVGFIGLAIGAIIHEYGHGFAFRVTGHDVETYELWLLAGIAPSSAATDPKYNGDGSSRLLDGLRIDAAGAFAEVLLLWPVVLVVADGLLELGWFGLFELHSVSGAFLLGMALSAVVGLMNLLPIMPADGGRFIGRIVGYAVERSGLGSFEDGYIASGIASWLGLGAIILVVLL